MTKNTNSKDSETLTLFLPVYSLAWALIMLCPTGSTRVFD